MASSVYQISWFSNDGKRIGVWRTTSKPIYSPDYPDWCQFTRMDTQKMVTLSFGIVAVGVYCFLKIFGALFWMPRIGERCTQVEIGFGRERGVQLRRL